MSSDSERARAAQAAAIGVLLAVADADPARADLLIDGMTVTELAAAFRWLAATLVDMARTGGTSSETIRAELAEWALRQASGD